MRVCCLLAQIHLFQWEARRLTAVAIWTCGRFRHGGKQPGEDLQSNTSQILLPAQFEKPFRRLINSDNGRRLVSKPAPTELNTLTSSCFSFTQLWSARAPQRQTCKQRTLQTEHFYGFKTWLYNGSENYFHHLILDPLIEVVNKSCSEKVKLNFRNLNGAEKYTITGKKSPLV